MSYAEEAVQRGGLAVAASNGRNAIAICLERPPDDAQAGPDHSNNGAASEVSQHVLCTLYGILSSLSNPRLALFLLVAKVQPRGGRIARLESRRKMEMV